MCQNWSIEIELHPSGGMREYIGNLWAAGLQWHLAKFGLQARAQLGLEASAANWNVLIYARPYHQNKLGFIRPHVDAWAVVPSWAMCTDSTGSNFVI